MHFGKLFGIGVGPGDPDLLTLKAVRALTGTGAVFFAASTRNDYSVALSIAGPHLRPDTPVHRLDFPMTHDRAELDAAWTANAAKVRDFLATGADAAFLTLGDPLIYSTFGYLMRALQTLEPAISIEIIPGITSFQASAARVGQTLCEGEENLVIASAARGAATLEALHSQADNLVLLKVYRKFPEIRDALERLDLHEPAVMVTRCGLDGEEIVPDPARRDGHPSYFSLLLIPKKR